MWSLIQFSESLIIIIFLLKEVVLLTLVEFSFHLFPEPGGPLTGLRLVDFGSGDGRIVAWAAKKGMHATGYELNPLGSPGAKGSPDGRMELGRFY